MKKILIALVCVILLFACSAVLAEDEPKNLMPMGYWNFDDVVTEQLFITGYYAVNDVSVVEGGANGTANCLKISRSGSGNGQWVYGLERDTWYMITAYIKCDNCDGTANPCFGVNNYDATNSEYKQFSKGNLTNEWKEYTLVFKTDVNWDAAMVWTWIHGDGNADLYIDEVNMYKLGKASDKDLMPMGYWNFEDIVTEQLFITGYYAVGNVAVVEGGANGTASCLKVSNSGCGNGQPIYGLKRDTYYVVDAWLKYENAEGTANPCFGVNNYDASNSEYKQYSKGNLTNEWKKYSLVFKTAPDWDSAMVWTWIHGEGNVDLYVDEVTLHELVK